MLCCLNYQVKVMLLRTSKLNYQLSNLSSFCKEISILGKVRDFSWLFGIFCISYIFRVLTFSTLWWCEKKSRGNLWYWESNNGIISSGWCKIWIDRYTVCLQFTLCIMFVTCEGVQVEHSWFRSNFKWGCFVKVTVNNGLAISI